MGGKTAPTPTPTPTPAQVPALIPALVPARYFSHEIEGLRAGMALGAAD
jgi:hypothetical protein